MKKLLISFIICGFHLVSFGQIEIDGIPAKIKQEYVMFDFTKFDEDIANLSKFKKSLIYLESWYKKKQGLKGDLGARISERLNRDKDEERVMTQYAVVIINFDEELTHSILQGEGVDYQNKYKKLVEKTKKGKVTPELGQIINANLTKISNKYAILKDIDGAYRNKLRNRQTSADFNSLFNSSKILNYVKEYISTEVVEEDNPVYTETQRKKKEKEVLASLPHHKYSGKYGNGIAEYFYKETPEGERIFDGKWIYRDHLADHIFTSEGQYKNDIRCGKWTWTFTYKGKKYFSQILNFDENGYLHGEVSTYNPNAKGQNYKIYFNHGRIIGKYTDVWDDKYNELISIEINNVGHVVGTAVCKQQDRPYILYETYENGKLVSARSTNYQTGKTIKVPIDDRFDSSSTRSSFKILVERRVINIQATWLNLENISPQRKSPELMVYE